MLSRVRSWLRWRRRPRRQLTLGTQWPFGLCPVSVSIDDFSSHLYISGTIGSGKSKLVQHLLFQLTTTGVGCGVIDPHSDLATDLIAQLASYPRGKPWLYEPHISKRLLYIDPFHSTYVTPANILKSSYASPHDVAENIVEAFRRVWPETLAEAPRFSQILSHSVIVLIHNNLSLVEMEELLTNPVFRERLLDRTPDSPTVSFFRNQYNRWGREQIIMASPVLNKLSAFLFHPPIRAMLGATENHLDFRQIIDEQKILIINLGGITSDETQRLLGALFLTSLEKAALSRENIQPRQRSPFFFFIDEFGLFASHDCSHMTKILSECRKYRLHLGLAHQTISQISGDRLHGALENAKLKILFQCGRQTAQAVMNQIFMPDPDRIKHTVSDEDAQQRSHPLFESLYNQVEAAIQEVMRLRSRRTVIKLPEHDTLLRLKTPTVPPSRISWEDVSRVRHYLVKQSGRTISELEQERLKRMASMRKPVPKTPTKGLYGFWEERTQTNGVHPHNHPTR